MTRAARAWRDALIYAAIWTALGLFAATQNVASTMYHRLPVDWWGIFGTQLLNWYTCGIGTPLYLWLVRRYPLDHGRILARLPLYVAVIILCIVAKYVVWVPLQNALFHSGWSFADALVPNVFGVATDQVYFLVLLYAIEFYRTARSRELLAAQLETQLSQARLAALRSQLQPHFLFNTLNSISALMRRDVDAADEMLARLSDMLRFTLAAEGGQEVSLRDEIAMLRLYLGIMQVRFRDRLETHVEVDEALLDERVPSFVLQPLVENTLRHGVGESSAMTTIRIVAEADGEMLAMRILDDGRGLPKNGSFREGIGLTNTRRRLDALYGEFGRLAVADRSGGGTEVTVWVPRRLRSARTAPVHL
jgi:signal transduction histidine kinase